MNKPKLYIAGQVKIETGDDELSDVDLVLIVQCYDEQQIRDALESGSVEFTVFGSDPAQAKRELDKDDPLVAIGLRPAFGNVKRLTPREP